MALKPSLFRPLTVSSRAARCALSCLAALALLADRPLSAQTWTGASDTSFSNAANWSGGAVPANDGTADLVFGSATGYAISLDASWSVHSLTFDNTATTSYVFTPTGSPTITVGSGGITNSSGRSLLNVAGWTIALPQNITYTQTAGTDTANWSFSGSGNITKAGTGRLQFASGGNNLAWTGSWTVSAGSLLFNNDNKLGAVPGTATPGQITLNGGTFNPTATMTINANRGIAVTAASTFTIASGTTTTYAGVMTGSGGLAVTGGTLALSGANTYSGTVIAGASGTVKISAANTLQYATITPTSGSLTFAVNSATIGALGGSHPIALVNGATGVALTVGGNNASTTFSSALGNTGSLTKTGSGTFTLSSVNTYSGTTTVNAGTLLVSGSLIGSGAVTVNSGGILGGGGFIAGLTTVATGGALSAGNNAVGTLTFSHGLALNAGSVLDFDLGTTSDEIRVSGGTLTGPGTPGGVTLDLFDTGTFHAGTYTLLDYTGATLGSFDATNFAIGTPIAGYNYSLAVAGSTLQLTATAVPEPAACAAVAGLAALALVLRRCRSPRA